MTEYEKIKRITIPLDDEHLLLITTSRRRSCKNCWQCIKVIKLTYRKKPYFFTFNKDN